MKNLPLITSLFFLFLIYHTSYSQEYKFHHLDKKQGLSHSFIYTINQDENGLLLVGTGEGVGVFDGTSFQMFSSQNRLAEDFVSSSLKDSKGNIWFGHKQGGASLYKDKTFDVVHSGDGINSIITDIAEDSEGRIWFSTQNKGLYFVDSSLNYEFFLESFSNHLIECIYFNEEDYLFIGSDQGLEIYKYFKDEKIISKVQDVSNLSNSAIVDFIKINDSQHLLVSRDGKFFKLDFADGLYSIHQISVKNIPEDIVVKELFYNNKTLYVSTLYSGLLSISLLESPRVVKNYNFKSGLNTNAVNTSFIDREGVLWVGTYGGGLASKANNYFSFYFRDKFEPKEYTFFAVNDDYIFTSIEASIYKYRKHDFALLKMFDSKHSLPDNKIVSFLFTSDSSLVVGTQEKGLYIKARNENSFKKINLSSDRLSDNIKCIKEIGSKLWVGTLNGVYKIDKKTFGISSFNLYNGLSHNNVGYVYNVQDSIYVGTKSAFVTRFVDNKVSDIQLSENLNLVNINMIDADSSGRLWLSSFDNGVFCVVKDTVLQYTVKDGLLSNYCYGVVNDSNNNIWVTHNGGISKYNPLKDDFEKYDNRYGLGVKFSKSAISVWGNEIWFATDNGIIRYDAKEEYSNKVPPITSVYQVKINDSIYDFKDDIVLPYGEYEVEIINRGLSLRKPKEVAYSYFLEGYEQSWSLKSLTNTVKYPKLSDGNYRYLLKSYNSDGVEGNTAEFSLFIDLPYWKKTWFYLLSLIFTFLLIVGIIKIREKNLIQIQKKLEFQLDLRTKEVVSQKEKIELINKDLTDSINYAKRIQLQLLPEKTNYKSILPKSFVLYKPKDIVSGDFYWLKDLGNEIIIVCADCTGHGVPGGFVSMIGSILVNEAVVFHNERDPSSILRDIDLNIKTVLHQKNDYKSNRDGMDLAIVNINKETGLMRFSGAVRPCYIYRDGKQTILKGNRFSIGGFSLLEKVFETTEFQLKKGDLIYLFSDGYADQFGGNDFRKLKMSGFHAILERIVKNPIDQQQALLDKELSDWMGENAQMDDILIMGFEYT